MADLSTNSPSTDRLNVKICGIRTADMLEATIAAGADMVGFMHFQRSPRHASIEEIGDLISLARGRIETCVVLVNPDNSCVAEVAALGPDWIQLHGPETPHRVEAIRAEAGLAVIKALPIGTAEDVARVAEFAEIADAILLDAKPPRHAERPGGHGTSFDWSLLKALDPAIGFMLSGGLSPDNVAEAIRSVRPGGVDASSGLETAPGVKNAALIEAFVRNVRRAG